MYTRKTMHLYALPQTFQNAQILRRRRTPAEKKLWKYLRNRQIEGVKFRQQHPIRKFVADFYTNELKLIIEVDGPYHNTPEQQLYDDDRTAILEEDLITVIRFENQSVIQATETVLTIIKDEVKYLKKLKGK